MGKSKIYHVDFQALESRNYASLNSIGKEIIDKMAELSTGKKAVQSTQLQAKIDLLMSALKELTPRQQKILEMSFGLDGLEPRSEVVIAKELGISHQGAFELKKRALNSLKKRMELNEDAIKNIKKSS